MKIKMHHVVIKEHIFCFSLDVIIDCIRVFPSCVTPIYLRNILLPLEVKSKGMSFQTHSLMIKLTDTILYFFKTNNGTVGKPEGDNLKRINLSMSRDKT